MWEQSQVLFVTLNVPGGSNNDADPGSATALPRKPRRKRRPEQPRARVERPPTSAGSMPPSRRRSATARRRSSSDCRRTCGIPKRDRLTSRTTGRSSTASRRTRSRSASPSCSSTVTRTCIARTIRLMIGAACQIESGASTTACANDPAATQMTNYPCLALSERIELPPHRRARQHAPDGVAPADDHTRRNAAAGRPRSVHSPGSAFSPTFRKRSSADDRPGGRSSDLVHGTALLNVPDQKSL